jgi:hypothetical protein
MDYQTESKIQEQYDRIHNPELIDATHQEIHEYFLGQDEESGRSSTARKTIDFLINNSSN